MSASQETLPLEGLTVIELASVLAGPSVGMFCAELGATVIKIENPATGGDVTRSWLLPNENPKDGISAYFSSVNWGKQSVAIQADAEEGKAFLYDILAGADIVINSFRTSSAKNLGIDYEAICTINPTIIYATITGFTTDEEKVAYDAVLQALSGFMDLNREPGGKPLKMPVALIDIVAGHQLKEALLIALLRRIKTGKGCEISISLYQAAITSLANQAGAYLYAGIEPQPTGTQHPTIAPYGEIFITSDNVPILLAVGTNKQFKALCETLNIASVYEQEHFANNARRVQHRHELAVLLQEHIATFTAATLLASLELNLVPAAPIQTVAQALDSQYATPLLIGDAANNQKGIRTLAATGNFPLHQKELSLPPFLGNRTFTVAESIGYKPEKIALLAEKGIIFQSKIEKNQFSR